MQPREKVPVSNINKFVESEDVTKQNELQFDIKRKKQICGAYEDDLKRSDTIRKRKYVGFDFCL